MATAAFQSILPTIVPFRVPRAIGSVLRRMLGINEIERIYEALRSMDGGGSIAERLLDFLAVTCSASQLDLARIPRSGAAILTVNHPFGILEGAILVKLLGGIRKDVRILANGILAAIPEIREMLVPVDPISGRKAVASNGIGLRRSLEHLKSGGMLVVFPAGEVSQYQWRDRSVTDSEWNPATVRMVRIAARRGCPVTVVPAYVEGANSAGFQLAGIAHAGLRTALLGRELLNKRGRRVTVRVGSPIAPDKLLAIPSVREQSEYLRWRTYLLAKREPYKPLTSLPLLRRRAKNGATPVIDAAPAHRLASEIAALPPACMLDRSGDLEVYIASAGRIPSVLCEIGRLREITFRAAGEGTGKSIDLDEFDVHYLHLFVWNTRRRELVGAYRLAQTDVVRRLYTGTLFRYDAAFLDRVGPALELGRSFIRNEYQRGFAPLLLLWKGIGKYVARNPRYKVLFGPVSISNRYEAASRELIVGFLEKYALLRNWSGLVRNRRALRGALDLKGLPTSGLDVEDLSTLVADIEEKPVGVPVLLRQYLRLGGKLLGFNVDPKFSNALDGLILVDLTRTEPKLLERYLGKPESATFLEFQKGNQQPWNTQERTS